MEKALTIHQRLGQSRELLLLSATDEDSDIVYESGEWGILERGRAQELLFQVMQEEYGFNSNNMDPWLKRPQSKSPWGPNNRVDNEDGTTVEFIAFPSTTIPGLVFHRERNFYPKTNRNISVSWHVSDCAPAFNIHLR